MFYKPWKKKRKKEKLFLNHYEQFRGLEEKTNRRFEFNKELILRCLDDNTRNTGFDRHYVYHLAWASRILRKTKPKLHIDISSLIYFSTIISAFIPTEFYDYRSAPIKLDNLISDFTDLTNLHFEDNSILSLSCMHTIEHVGLGRYGDNLDYDGDLKAMKELSRVLAPTGDLLFVVPLGSKPKIQFNAHRIYSKQQIIDYYSEFGLILKEFTLIPESSKDGGLVVDPGSELLSKQNYACGCFWLSKV